MVARRTLAILLYFLSLQACRPEFATYQQQVVKNAKSLADGLMSCGYNIVSGGTDTHLMLLDLRDIGNI